MCENVLFLFILREEGRKNLIDTEILVEFGALWFN